MDIEKFLQGDLQAYFDALYGVGVIDPILKSDWSEINNQAKSQPELMSEALRKVNGCNGDTSQLLAMMKNLDGNCLNFLALEVAREFAEYQDRKEIH